MIVPVVTDFELKIRALDIMRQDYIRETANKAESDANASEFGE